MYSCVSALFTIFVTISDEFAVDVFMTLNFEMSWVQMHVYNQNQCLPYLSPFPRFSKSNWHDLDLDLYKGPRPNAKYDN